jgi:hypothetical protein
MPQRGRRQRLPQPRRTPEQFSHDFYNANFQPDSFVLFLKDLSKRGGYKVRFEFSSGFMCSLFLILPKMSFWEHFFKK